MKSTVQTISFNTTKELVDHLLHDAPENSFFRGQQDSDWDLTPAAWRPMRLEGLQLFLARRSSTWPQRLHYLHSATPELIAERYCGNIRPESIERCRRLVVALGAEQFISDSFAEMCNRAGLTLPAAEYAQISHSFCEERVLQPEAAFHSLVREIPAFRPTTCLALAQHLGLPTRLLDVSENPLKALYFAVCDLPFDGILAVPSQRLAVWTFQPPDAGTLVEFMQDGGSDISIMRVLRSQISYLHAQEGLFLSSGARGNLFFLEQGRWPSLEEVMGRWKLTKLTLPWTEREAILKSLRRLGLHAETMKPSFESAAIQVKRVLEKIR